MTRFKNFRNIAAPQVPMPILAASAAAWSEDDHAAENRALYRRKIDMAERTLGNRFGFYRPAGGFFLWLDVGDGERAAFDLWAKGGIKVLPGAYLSRDTGAGNPGRGYVRVALVGPAAETEDALTRIRDTLYQEG